MIVSGQNKNGHYLLSFFANFQSILHVFFHTVNIMYSGQALKRTKVISKVVLSYRLLISWHVKTHFTRFVVSDAIFSLNMLQHEWDLRAMANNGLNLVRKQIINSKPILWYFYGVFLSFLEPESVCPPLLSFYGKELGQSAFFFWGNSWVMVSKSWQNFHYHLFPVFSVVFLQCVGPMCASDPGYLPLRHKKIGWMRERKSLNDWGRGMGGGGFFFVASLCSRHEVPKNHQFYLFVHRVLPLSLCLFYSLCVSRPSRLFLDYFSS